jgi:hypothetical protein
LSSTPRSGRARDVIQHVGNAQLRQPFDELERFFDGFDLRFDVPAEVADSVGGLFRVILKFASDRPRADSVAGESAGRQFLELLLIDQRVEEGDAFETPVHPPNGVERRVVVVPPARIAGDDHAALEAHRRLGRQIMIEGAELGRRVESLGHRRLQRKSVEGTVDVEMRVAGLLRRPIGRPARIRIRRSDHRIHDAFPRGAVAPFRS